MKGERRETGILVAYLVAAAIAGTTLCEHAARHLGAFRTSFSIGDGTAGVVLGLFRGDERSIIATRFFAFPFIFVAKLNYGSSLDFQCAAGEATLVSESRRTLEEQFDRILNQHGPAISRLAFGYEAVASVREELVQEIALAIWQALPHFRGECSERTFVFRIAHNRGLSHAWKRRPPLQPLDDLEESQQPIDPRPQPEEQAAQIHQRARLMSAIQSLPVTLRQMMVLMLEDLSHAEIAEVMGITENNVAVRMNRARKALKDALGVRQ
jgi:RNA polymerase sigma factor (sigma-70 family)